MPDPTIPTPIIPGLRNFTCYRKALELATLVYAIPVRGETREQMQRSAGSVVRNIAEGSAAGSVAMQSRYYGFSRASLWEVSSDLDMLVARGQPPRDLARMASLACEVDAMLAKMLRRR